MTEITGTTLEQLTAVGVAAAAGATTEPADVLPGQNTPRGKTVG